jgi:cytochrome bd-type quinol oxidase subunit 2
VSSCMAALGELAFGLLDHRSQFLDAYAYGRVFRGRQIPDHGSLSSHLQPRRALGGFPQVGGLPRDLAVRGGGGQRLGFAVAVSALVAAGVLRGYSMLGTNCLILRTEGGLQQRRLRYSLITSVVTLLVSVCVHIRIIPAYPHVLHKWTRWPDLVYVSSFLVLAVFAFLMFFRSLKNRSEVAPLFWNAAIILFSFIGISIGL